MVIKSANVNRMKLSFESVEQVKYEIGGFSVVNPVSLLIESLYVESFDCNSDLKGGEFKSANHRISVFICVSLLSSFFTYIISHSLKRDKCAITRRLNVNQNNAIKTEYFDDIFPVNNHTVEELKKQQI